MKISPMKFIPAASLKVGDAVAYGLVTGVRRSKSGKTTTITIRHPDGSPFTYKQSTNTNIAIHIAD